MNIQTILIISALILIAVAAFYILTSKGGKPAWKEKVLAKLKQINSQADSTNKEALKSTLSEADKLADFFLKSRGVRGETMGERLKNAKTLFSKDEYNTLWLVHKERNRIAHEMDYEPSANSMRHQIKDIVRIVKKNL